YEQQTKWLRIFDLMAKLIELLRDQKVVSDLLEAEQDGAINIDESNTIRATARFILLSNIVILYGCFNKYK
ncbi:hypothetical protein BD408DRAFT_339514, partial [Parasitella parasitica]